MCSLFGTGRHRAEGERQAGRLAAPAPTSCATPRGTSRAARAPRAPRRTLAVLRELSDAGSEIVEARCDRGASIVRSLGCPEAAAEAVLPARRALERQGQPAPACRRCDRAAVPHRRARAVGRRVQRRPRPGRGAEMVRERSGRWFEPEVADAFLRIGDDDRLWATCCATGRRAGARPRSAGARPVADDAGPRPGLARRSPTSSTRSRRSRAALARRGGLRACSSARRSGSAPTRCATAPRGPAARHRQARRAELDPRQAGQADRRGVRHDAPAPAVHGGDPARRRGVRAVRRDGRRAPRADGRPRLPPRRARRRPPAGGRAPWPSPTCSRP